jgi:hypothetical protein
LSTATRFPALRCIPEVSCLLLVTLVACGGGEPSITDSAGIPIDALVGDCAVDSSARHEDPVALVEEFVRRDAEGPFEREDLARAWLASAVSCPGRLTSNHYEVIDNFSVDAGPRSRDSAQVLVRRFRLFDVARDESGRATELVPAPGTWIDTVVVVRTTLGWRIHDIAAGAHRFPGLAASELQRLSGPDRRILDSLAARPGGR